ncbi:MAG: FtsX-like permease family protein [Actinomycetota bacterium]
MRIPAAATVFARVNLRHLRERRLRSALTVTGVAAGVALVFSISVINATLLSSFRSSLRAVAGAAEIEVAGADQTGLPADAVTRVAAVEGVEQAVPVVRTLAAVGGPDGRHRVMFLGVTPAFAGLFPSDPGPLGRVVVQGGFGPDGRGVLLGTAAIEVLGARVSDRVAVETPSGARRVTVAGSIGGGPVAAFNGGRIAVMLLPAAQELFARGGQVDSIYVVVDPDADVAEVEGAIGRTLGGAGIVGAPGERERGLERVFSSLSTLLSLAGTVALFVALFVVYNTMSMSLAERRRELAMALALGATRSQLFAATLVEAVVIGTIAAVAGVAGGLLLARMLVEQAIEGYRILPISGSGAAVVAPTQALIAALGGIAVSLAGALVPARRVLAVAPIEALRPDAAYEWRAGTRHARAAALGVAVVAVALAVATFFAYVVAPERKWLVTLGMVFGMVAVTSLLPLVVPLGVRLIRPLLRRSAGTVGRLAGDSLATNPGRTTFTVAALVLTLGMVLGVGSALASYQRQIELTAGALIGAPLYVTAESFSGLTSDQPLSLGLQPELEAVPGVAFVYPLRFVLLNVGDEQGVMYAISVEEALREGATTALSAITDDPDAFLDGLSAGDIAVSHLTARRHDLSVGDELVLPTPSGARAFEVASVFDDLSSLDTIYMDDRIYRKLWRDDKVDEFGVLLDPGASLGEVRAGLQDAVRRTGTPARVYEKRELVGRILELIAGTFSLARGIQLAALVVALVTIANTMFTAVLERRWEMGLQRAVGMSETQLRREVLVEAAAIGSLGGAGGAVVGTITGYVMTLSMEVQFAWDIPFRPPLALGAAAILAGIVLAAGAGLVPSRLAGRAPIIESLRYE